MRTKKTFRQQTRTEDFPGFKDDFMLAVDVKEGNSLTLPGKGSKEVTHVELGVNLNWKWVVLVTTKGGDVHEFSPRSYIPAI